ncbi:ABC transporter ATP-binding protein [Candidatus Protochlamydia sp. W-9]|uniref:ABC transporter ATP-binding protein n=1 Tax=Candidatus Protochlamydia sp. W-9 TaxID=1785087 RepID=UPI00096A4269|nr:ABC transporter ATP-binding protein [Candidatus Protochlamydia sp. W-9]
MPQATLPKTFPAFFWFFLKKQWKWLLFAQIFSFAWSLDHTLWPYVIMTLIDTITNFAGPQAEVWHALAKPIIMGISLWLGVEISFRLAGFIIAYIVPKIEADIRMSMFQYVMHHSHQYFSSHMAGSIANKIADLPQSLTRLLTLIVQLFLPACLALIISTTMFAFINPFFALILISWVIIHMGICLAFSKKCDDYSNTHAESRTLLSGKIIDSLSNNANIRLFSKSQFEASYLSFFQEDELNKHWRSLFYMEKMKIALGIACFLGACIALNWYMLYSWQQGELSAGEVVFIFNTTWNITIMAWLAGLELPQVFKEIGICKQALTVIQDTHDIIDSPFAEQLTIHQGEIIFDNVTFRYQKQQSLFQNMNITIEAGQKVGLVGFSGSGKTTFINLILRNYDIESGRILIDNQDISKVTQASLRGQISIIPQDPTLFHRSLIDNIRYARPDATDEEVIEASKQAHCHEFILKLPDKYQTLVGERGSKLSGGQRQRIAIARAILKNAPILILDEATSALDSVTERNIQEGLEFLMKDHTSLVIAHRLSTLSGMDRILVFKEGKIIEDGTHEELIQANQHYANMWEMQVGGFLIDNYDELEDEESEIDSSVH